VTGAGNVNFNHVRLEKRAGVAHLVLARPDKLNALGFGPGASRDEIVRALADADADAGIGCILISAEGRAFCAGGDVSGLPDTPTPADDRRMVEQVDRFNAAVRGVSKPVIAAVHGRCLGAGLGFIAQCDFVLASDDASFGLPEGRFGHPGGSELVPLIGSAWAKFLIFSGESIDAAQAVEIGLALLVVSREALLAHATELAERIARMPRDAVSLNKAAIDRAAEAGGRAAGRLAGRTGDVLTKAMSRYAQAPDGRLFEAILATAGVAGLKEARNQQYVDSWLDAVRSSTGKQTK
jgi:enoyl-CoA hydratase/carnithine racemase